MIGPRSNSKWFVKLGGFVALIATLPVAAEREQRLSWATTVPAPMTVVPAVPLREMHVDLAFPTDVDFFVSADIAVQESLAELWPDDATPEVVVSSAPSVPEAEEVAPLELVPVSEDWTVLTALEAEAFQLPEPAEETAVVAVEPPAVEAPIAPEPMPETDWVDLVAMAPAAVAMELPAIEPVVAVEVPVYDEPEALEETEEEREVIAAVEPIEQTVPEVVEPTELALPTTDWVDVAAIATEAAPKAAVLAAAPLPAPAVSIPNFFEGWTSVDVDVPEVPADEAASAVAQAPNPWDEMEFFGPVAALGDIEVLESAEPETDAETEQPLEAVEAAPVAAEVAAPEETDAQTPLIDEEFAVAEDVLEEAANTEYLEDLGLLAAVDTEGYDAVADEIAATGIELMDGADDEDAPREPRYGYEMVAEGEAPTMTLDEILELALANNPEVGAALAREEQAQWAFREAQVYKYPSIDVLAEAGPEYNRPATNTSHNEDITPGRTLTFRVTQLLYDGGVSLNESDRRLQVRRSTELETRLIVEEIVVRAAEFYSQVLQHQRASAVAAEFVQEMQSIVDKLEVMFESGAASKLELDFAKARLASARAETGNTKAQLNDALSNLEFLTGELQEFTAVPPSDIHAMNVLNLYEYIDVARKQNAEVLLNRSAKKTLRYKIRAERAKFSPIFSLNMKSEALADEGGNLEGRNTTEVKLKAEYFLFDGGARKARLNRSRAQLKELEFEDERLYKEVDRQVKQAYNQITTNRLTLDATEDEIASNRELRRMNRENLEIGDISIIELIEVEERLFNSQATWYRVSSEMFQNYYELLVSTGELAKLVGTEHTQTRIEDEAVSGPLEGP